MKNIHIAIKTIRQAKNISRADISKHLEMGEMSYGKIERGEVSINLEKLYKIAEIFQMEAEDVLAYGKESNLPTSIKKGNITYVPAKAQAGYLSELLDEVNDGDCISFDLPFFRGSNLYMIDVEGDSMNPTVNHGDYAVVRKIENQEDIKYGVPYVVESEDGRVMKRIYSNDNNNRLTLKSDNEVYEPYSVSKESVLSIWEVKGFMSKDLSPRNIYQKRMQLIEDNMREMSRYFKGVNN